MNALNSNFEVIDFGTSAVFDHDNVLMENVGTVLFHFIFWN